MKISSADISDSIYLKANIRSLFCKRYHCDSEIDDMKRRLNNKYITNEYRTTMEERINNFSKIRSCGHVSKKRIDRIDNIEFYTCLCKFKHPSLDILLFMDEQLQHGNLPCSGGILDQPAQSIELIRIVQESLLKEKLERTKADGKRRN